MLYYTKDEVRQFEAQHEDSFEAGANYVLDEVESLMKDVSDEYPRFQQGTIIHGRLIKLLEQLKNKVMKEEDKIYFDQHTAHYNHERKNIDDIEYVRADAFIEKAKKWFECQNEWFDLDSVRHCDLEDFEDFKKAMKGEKV